MSWHNVSLDPVGADKRSVGAVFLGLFLPSVRVPPGSFGHSVPVSLGDRLEGSVSLSLLYFSGLDEFSSLFDRRGGRGMIELRAVSVGGLFGSRHLFSFLFFRVFLRPGRLFSTGPLHLVSAPVFGSPQVPPHRHAPLRPALRRLFLHFGREERSVHSIHSHLRHFSPRLESFHRVLFRDNLSSSLQFFVGFLETFDLPKLGPDLIFHVIFRVLFLPEDVKEIAFPHHQEDVGEGVLLFLHSS